MSVLGPPPGYHQLTVVDNEQGEWHRLGGKRVPEAPRAGRAATHVFFGATVRYANAAGTERVIRIVGLDEVDLDRNYVSWVSPLARALMKSGPGDSVVLHAPGGAEELDILEVRYERIPMEPFTEPPGAEAAPKQQ